VDYLIREFAAGPSGAARTPSAAPHLLIAGAGTNETDDLVSLSQALAPGRIRVLRDLPREEMPFLYRALDVFVLASLFEMMPIAVLEAMASGLPVIANRHPVLQWMIGADESQRGETAGGRCADLSAPDALSEALAGLTPEWIRARGAAARRRAETVFCRDAVIRRYVAYYETVCGADPSGSPVHEAG
jgi:glycosyltransferase involved in cell wall biosynthesis